MTQPIYRINEFPMDDRFWRIVLFGGVTLSPKVPSEPVIEVLLASLPHPDVDPLGELAMKSYNIYRALVGVGQLPYLSMGSVWHRREPVQLQRHLRRPIEMVVDTSRVRFVSIGDLVNKYRAIPRSHYAFGKHWPIAATTEVAAIESEGDPWAILIPVSELIRFYYAASTRLAQALFWGEYAKSINWEKCGQLDDGPYRVHLRKWIYDSDAWTLARFHASAHMQRQVQGLYKGYQRHFTNSFSVRSEPFRGFQCGFPFSGETCLEAIYVPLPGPSMELGRMLVVKLLRCSAPFPFDELLCDRDNRNLKGKNSGEADLEPAWRRRIEEEDRDHDEWENPPNNTLHSDEEPFRGKAPLVIDLQENRFSFLDGKKLLKEEPERQKYRSAPMVGGKSRRLSGFGTGSGIWGNTLRKRAEINTTRSGSLDRPTLSPSLRNFFLSMNELSSDSLFKVRYVAALGADLVVSEHAVSVGFPNLDPTKKNKRIKWAETTSSGGVRPRQVAVAEVTTPAGVCYVLEAERLNPGETLSILVVSAQDRMRLAGVKLHSILLGSACKGRWLSVDEMPELRRATTTHQQFVSARALGERIARKAREVLGIPVPRKSRVAQRDVVR